MNQMKLLASAALFAALATPAAFAASSNDVKDVQNAKMSLSDAIQAAQKVESGKAIYGKFHDTNGIGKYEVVVVNSSGKTDTLEVDPTTGEAVKAKRENAPNTDKKGEAVIENAQVGMAEAITTAQAQGGRAMEAELDTKDNKTTYEIKLANGDNTSTVWVDVNSGQIVKKS